ncbi:MAG: serine/threonine protein kinase, partial [Candidatus Aminicenantes bacterium]|nr:serine/threonine protein kinase [Candidatus Aminicenantes bacterium]
MTDMEGTLSGTKSGINIGSSRFDEEVRSFLQRRLRMLTSIFAGIFLGASLVVIILQVFKPQVTLGDALAAYATTLPLAVLFFVTLATSALAGFLWARRVNGSTLSILDAAFLQVLIMPCLFLFARYHQYSFPGFSAIVPCLMLFILTRSIFIPSRAGWTVILSSPASLGVLGLQLIAGGSYIDYFQRFQGSHFAESVLLNQILILGTILVAATASRLHLGLRLENFKARNIGQYSIEKLLGRGGMGEVYLATHSLLKRPTALKFLRPDIAGIKTLARFEKEVRLTSRLSHPNTISIYDYGHTAEGIFYYAMEFLHGANLRQVLKETGPMPPERVIYILTCACGALKEAHDKGIVHRDIKPENIMLCELGGEQDVLKILDFGLVRDLRDPNLLEFEEDGSVSGTPETISPEALSGGTVGPLSDLYSLCAVGCFLLTGKPIFNAKTVIDFLKSHQYSMPIMPSKRRPGIPADLERILMRGLKKKPASRYQSMAAMKEALLNCGDAGKWTGIRAEHWWNEHEYLLEKDFKPAQNGQYTQTLLDGVTVT